MSEGFSWYKFGVASMIVIVPLWFLRINALTLGYKIILTVAIIWGIVYLYLTDMLTKKGLI